jgi:hypothetical protein
MIGEKVNLPGKEEADPPLNRGIISEKYHLNGGVDRYGCVSIVLLCVTMNSYKSPPDGIWWQAL